MPAPFGFIPSGNPQPSCGTGTCPPAANFNYVWPNNPGCGPSNQGQLTYLQTTQPTSIPVGTLWLDGAPGGISVMYRWNGLSYDQINLGAIQTGSLLISNNLSDVANVATSRANLGLGSAATYSSSAFLQSANNLSDLTNAITARANLGLGSAATYAASAFLLSGASAGGDLTGTYPSPTLASIISAAGPIGDSTHTPQITVDAKGRITAITSIPIAASSGTVSGPGTTVTNDLVTWNNTTGTSVQDPGHWSITSNILQGSYTTATSRVVGENLTTATAATSGNPKWSPSLQWTGHYYSAGSLSSNWFAEIQTNYVYNSVTYNGLVFSSQDNGGVVYPNLVVLNGNSNGIYAPTVNTPYLAAASSLALQTNGSTALNFTNTQTATFSSTVGVGNTALTTAGLLLKNSLSAASGSIQALLNNTTLTAAANSVSLYGVQSQPTFALSTYTSLVAYNAALSTPSVSGSGTIATAYQLYIDAGATATNSYGIYQNGTNQNVFNGTVTANNGFSSASNANSTKQTYVSQNSYSGTAAVNRANFSNNTNAFLIDVTSTAYSGSIITNAVAGQSVAIYTNAAVPVAIGVNSQTVASFDTSYNTTLFGELSLGGTNSNNACIATVNSMTGTSLGAYFRQTQTASGNSQSFVGVQSSPTWACGSYNSLTVQNVVVGTPSYSGTNALNAYQLYIGAGAPATNGFGIYQAGTDINILAGQLYAGAQTSTAAQLGIKWSSASTQGMVLQTTNSSTSGNLLYFVNSSGSSCGSISFGSGQTSVAYNTSSDARLKTNVRDFTASGAIIDALKPRIYDWLSGPTNDIGFVAQEMYQVFPTAVVKGDDDPTTITQQWQRSDLALVPVLVAEAKALRTRVASLESQLAALAAQVAALVAASAPKTA